MLFEELDAITRRLMLREFEAEIAGPNPYFGKGLSPEGHARFPAFMLTAIQNGNEVSLAHDLDHAGLWNPTETYVRNGVTRERQVNVRQAAERLALTEFNTWYVRGLAKRLMDEGVAQCQAYRAAQPKWEPADCSAHEGQIFVVEAIYRSHRARYWPRENPDAISIPFGPGCHHSIRRVIEAA